MEALAAIGVVANFAGIIGIAIQLVEILEKAIHDTRTADERVQCIAIELRVLASTLTKVRTLSNDRFFTDEESRNINLTVQQCGKILDKIALSFSKMGRVAVLDIKDEQQRRIQNLHTAAVPYSKLTFDFSIKGRVMWPFKLRGILQSLAELNQLKTNLLLNIAVAEAANQNRRTQMEAAREKGRLISLFRRNRKSSALSNGPSTTQSVESKQQLCIDAAPANNPHFGAQKTTWNHHKRLEEFLALLAV